MKTNAAGAISQPTSRLLSLAYYVVLALIFGWAAYIRFRLPRWPLSDPDTWGYLKPALSELGGNGFVHTNARNFLYPGFLLLILWPAKSLGAISIVQHLLGLGAGGLILSCWEKMRRFLRAFSGHAFSIAGLLLTALYLFSSRPILFEHEIRPESITPFFALLNILLTLRFIEQRARIGPSAPLALTASLLLINSVLLATLKTSFLLTVLFSVVPVLVALFDRRENWSRRILILSIGLVVAVSIFETERSLAKTDRAAAAFMPESLFTIHANLIVRQMDEDVARGDCGPYACDWLTGVAKSLHEEMTKSWESSDHYHSFGFDPDYLLYAHDSLKTWTGRFFEGDFEKQLTFYHFYYARVWKEHPSRMVDKIVTQMRLFYSLGNPSFITLRSIRLGFYYGKSVMSLKRPSQSSENYPLLAHYMKRCRQLSFAPDAIHQNFIIRGTNGLLSRLYLPVLTLVLAVTVVLRFKPRLRQCYWAFAIATLFAFSYNFGNCLGTSIVHSLHIKRYSWAQFPFTLLAECVGMLFLADFFWKLRMERRRAK